MDLNGTRRHLLQMGCLGLAAATTGASSPAGAVPVTSALPAAASPSATELANIRLVREFIAAFQDPSANFVELMDRYLAPNASVRWVDTQVPVYGPKAALAKLMANYPKNATFSIDIRDIFAHGPLVATYRVDTMSMPGSKDMIASVAGVHIVKAGKLVEYCDYIVI